MNPSFVKIGRTSPPLRGTSSTALRFGNHLEKEPYHRKRSPRETSPPLRGTSPIRGGFVGGLGLALEFA